MSLILDALRKLERQKDVTEPAVVLVGAVPWQGLRRPLIRPRPLLALLAGLCGLGILWGLWHARPSPASSEARRMTPPRETAAPAAAVNGLAAVRQPRQRTQAAGERSAAISATSVSPSLAPSPARAELRLNAISVREGRPVALINDRLVHEGDLFDGVRILRIGAAEVEVEVGGQRRLLTF